MLALEPPPPPPPPPPPQLNRPPVKKPPPPNRPFTHPERLLHNLKLRTLNSSQKRSTPLAQALAIQHVIFSRIADPKVTDSALASLARSWAVVQEAVRVMRGIPQPGQLRPDLDPVQMTRALKRLKARLPVDIGSRIEEPSEHMETEQQPIATTPSEPKESLSTEETAPTEPPPEAD